MIPSFYATLDNVQSYLGAQGTVAVCDFYISERCRNTSAAAGVNYQYVAASSGSVLGLTHCITAVDGCRVCSGCTGSKWTISTCITLADSTSNISSTAANHTALATLSSPRSSRSLSECSKPCLRPRSLTTRVDSYIFIGEHKAPETEKQAIAPAANVRLPYDLVPDHKEFRSWIYGFTWEDPAVDMEAFKCGPDETIFCITSAGCNVRVRL